MSRILPSIDFDVRGAVDRATVEAQCRRYAYLRPEENALYPVAAAARYDVAAEIFGPRWAIPFVPSLVSAVRKRVVARIGHRLRRRFEGRDTERSHRDFFGGDEPDYLARLHDDGQFGWNRVGGINPTLIERVRSVRHLHDRMPALDEARFASVMGTSRSLAREIDERRLFLCDYAILAKAIGTPAGRCSRWREKYLPAPVVLLCERPGVLRFADLVPVAITIDQPEAHGPNPLYLRDDSVAWRIAKYFVEVADHCHHMAVGHLSCAHFIMGAVALSTRRQLLPNHPVRILLETHTAHTLPVNGAAFQNFLDPSQLYARFYAGEIEETAAIAREARRQRDFLDLDLERDLLARGTSDALDDYPFRDDARLFVPPTLEFTEAFVEAHYPDDASVRMDPHLSAWAHELVDPNGGNLGRLHDRPLDSRRSLAAILARILFVAGPGHAAQHFAEMLYCRFAPMYPAAAYRPPPASPDEATEEYLAAMLPPLDVAGEHFMYSDFGAYRFDVYGHYRDPRVLGTPRLREAGLRFERRLVEAERTIERRNAIRLLPYEILLPSKVPNVINF